MSATAPNWLRPAAVAALLWNLMGCAAYLADQINLSGMDRDPPAELLPPWWAIAGTATAVWLGAAGCVGLLLRRRWAAPLLFASLAGVLAQDLWLFAIGRHPDAGTPLVIGLQALVLAAAAALAWAAARGVRAGWLR